MNQDDFDKLSTVEFYSVLFLALIALLKSLEKSLLLFRLAETHSSIFSKEKI